MDTPLDKTKDTLAQWLACIINAMSAANMVASYATTNSGSYLGEMTVYRNGVSPEIKYTIKFLRKLYIDGGKRVLRAEVMAYNPKGGLTVHLKGFASTKVDKLVEYATTVISQRVEQNTFNNAKRKRTTAAKELWRQSGVELPDWMSAEPNVNNDENLGTFYVLFHEHRNNYGLKFLTPQQIGRIASHIQQVINEPSVQQAEKELAAKLLGHEGKCSHVFRDTNTCVKCGWKPTAADLKYDKKADDKQWMDLTINR